MRNRASSLLILLGLVLSATSVLAAPRDKAAQKKIEEAIYTDFLNTDFDGAEGLLLGTIRACEDKCSPSLVAKAWMYVGVIRGSGRNDISGAQEAFTTAIGIDPNVQLDNEIATDPVKAAFAKVKASAGSAAPTAGGTEATPAAAPSSFTCAPAPTEIQTRRPFPLQCEANDKIQAVKLHYKAGDSSWATVNMELQDGSFRGTIPCSATQSTGSLQYYAEGLDSDGEQVASYGTDDEPKSADIMEETTADPPAFPDEQPPARCAVSATGGAVSAGSAAACGDIDSPCGPDDCCADGLTCNEGICETGEGRHNKHGEYPKNWIGLHFAMDIASVSSDGACSKGGHDDNFACFEGNTSYTGTVSNGAAGKINGGFVPATMRIMASYERLFGAFGLEGRLGFAFNGGKTPQGGNAFLPVHAEARAKWWLRGASAFEKPGFRPWLHVGIGVAQVDAKVKVDVVECTYNYGQDLYDACLRAGSPHDALVLRGKLKQGIEATKQLGEEFVTVGGGVMYAVAKNHGAVLNLNLMIPFPSVGFVFEPSVGYEYAF